MTLFILAIKLKFNNIYANTIINNNNLSILPSSPSQRKGTQSTAQFSLGNKRVTNLLNRGLSQDD